MLHRVGPHLWKKGMRAPEWYVKKQIGGNLSMEKQIKTIGVLTSGGDAPA